MSSSRKGDAALPDDSPRRLRPVAVGDPDVLRRAGDLLPFERAWRAMLSGPHRDRIADSG